MIYWVPRNEICSLKYVFRLSSCFSGLKTRRSSAAGALRSGFIFSSVTISILPHGWWSRILISSPNGPSGKAASTNELSVYRIGCFGHPICLFPPSSLFHFLSHRLAALDLSLFLLYLFIFIYFIFILRAPFSLWISLHFSNKWTTKFRFTHNYG